MLIRRIALLLVSLTPLPGVSLAQSQDSNAKFVRVALFSMPYVGERNAPELSGGPDSLAHGGIQKLLEERGFQAKLIPAVKLTADEDKAYGSWNRLALANGDLAKLVAEERRSGYVPVGLLANCSSILGMLSGLQHSGPTAKPLRVGMIFVDAHGDFNTPETTLSGMLGGMPVAIAAGQCLTRLRIKTGLEPAVPTRHIVEICVRDTDPLEQELLDRSDIQQLTLEDVRTRSADLHREMKRLSDATDAIYVHVDMDALDPREVAGHPLTVPGGPTSAELAAALTEMFKYEKTAAVGIASTPYGDHDKAGLSRQAAYNLILGAMAGVQQRKTE
ncbi:MAG TPA: arginase family protein [Candidatus Udaeobacter sp.]|nr:arginase family protein [Candidatus Udaeobacter sp.]